MRRIAAVFALLLAIAACTPQPKFPEPERTRVVGVQLFMWTWDAIADECRTNLGPNQFAFVLTSPPQEHIKGEAWWTHYQPVSYKIDSRLGTREQFANMVKTCHESGVKVIADAVINHMAGVDGGTGWAGSSFSHYDYPGIYSEDDFHRCSTPGGDISNYFNSDEVQTCELSNLADLRTESEHVRNQLRAYLDDLRSLGVDGFRIDAAKHMPAEDVAAIVGENQPLVISEVIPGIGEPIKPEHYLGVGSVFAFDLARDFKTLAQGANPKNVLELSEPNVPSEKAFTFVTNHDTQRTGQTLSYHQGETFEHANVYLMAATFGTPITYSGFAFANRDQGPKLEPDGRISKATCPDDAGPAKQLSDGDWVCEHRWPATSGMVDWRSVVEKAPVSNVWSDDSAVAFDRGEVGFLAINAGNEPKTIQTKTSLPAGTYCNALTAPSLASKKPRCNEGEFTVADGQVKLELAPKSTVALHVGLRAS